MVHIYINSNITQIIFQNLKNYIFICFRIYIYVCVWIIEPKIEVKVVFKKKKNEV
jgi:hypothetical protein